MRYLEIFSKFLKIFEYLDKFIAFYLNDLLLSLDNIRSFEYLKDTGLDSNFLTWSALRLSVPKDKLSSFPLGEFDPMTFKCENTEFNTYSAKSKQFFFFKFFFGTFCKYYVTIPYLTLNNISLTLHNYHKLNTT